MRRDPKRRKNTLASARGFATAAFIALAASPAAADRETVSAECGDIVLAEFSWATAGLSSRLLELVLSDGYGCDVRRQPAAPTRAAPAIAASNEAMRAAAANAAPLGAAPLDAPAAVIAVGGQLPGIDDADGRSTLPDGVAVGAELYGGLDRSGWFAPSWLAASHGDVRRIEDAVRRPEVFATTPKAKPKLHICPKNWPCHADDRALVEQLRLEERFEIVTPPSGDALTASLIEAWRHRKPWIGSYWTPSAAVAEHSMTRLESGTIQICSTKERPADRGPDAEPICRPPHASSPRVTLFPKALQDRAPRVAAALRRFALPPEVALEALAWRATSNADLDDAALQVLDSRPRLWRTWLDEPARKRFASALAARLKEADARAAQARDSRDPGRPPSPLSDAAAATASPEG